MVFQGRSLNNFDYSTSSEKVWCSVLYKSNFLFFNLEIDVNKVVYSQAIHEKLLLYYLNVNEIAQFGIY